MQFIQRPIVKCRGCCYLVYVFLIKVNIIIDHTDILHNLNGESRHRFLMNNNTEDYQESGHFCMFYTYIHLYKFMLCYIVI